MLFDLKFDCSCSCPVCGGGIGMIWGFHGVDSFWMLKYRALYNTPNGVKLGDICTAKGVWEHMTHDHLIEEIGIWRTMAIANPPEAYHIHEDCWIMLTQHLESVAQVDLGRIFEIFKDIPLGIRNDYERNPGRVVGSELSNRLNSPLKQPIFPDVRRAKKKAPPCLLKEMTISFSTSDCFGILPVELQSQIATELPTSDFFNSRFASRSMMDIYWDQNFWKSRFLPYRERGFLFCVLSKPQAVVIKDWRLLYRRTVHIGYHQSHLWEKRRQWQVRNWFRERHAMIKASDEQVKEYRHLIDQLTWQGVSTKLRCDRSIDDRNPSPFRQGDDPVLCRRCGVEHTQFVQAVPWTDTMAGLAIFILHEGADTYITGFDLLEGDLIAYRPKFCFGYQIPGEYTILSRHGKRLRGFTLISGEFGIHGLRAKFDDTYSEWIGQPGARYADKSTELVLKGDIGGFLGKFDHCKMIEFSIASKSFQG